MVDFNDDEANALFGEILIHYDKITGTRLPSMVILKRVFQNEIDAWGE